MSSGHPLQEAIEVSQTTLDEKDPFFLRAWNFSCIRTPQNGAVGVTRLTYTSIHAPSMLGLLYT
jgi:hypothetical protein